MKKRAKFFSTIITFSLLLSACGSTPDSSITIGETGETSTNVTGDTGSTDSNSGNDSSQNTGTTENNNDHTYNNDDRNQSADTSESNAASAEAAIPEDTSDMFTKRDRNTDYTENNSVRIQLNGDSATCSSGDVKISGSTVTICDEGTFIISGTLDDGMIIVDADDSDKPHLVLDGVNINSDTSAAIYILEADKVVVTLADGTENTLSNGGTFTAIDDNNIDAAFFSKQDLTFNGSGSLTVNSPASHGIVGKDDLVFTGGTYTVNSASHGLDANDSVRITNTSLTLSAGKDGIHAENSDDATLGFVYIADGTLDISAEGDGISAGAYLQIEGGTFTIISGGGSENAAVQTSDSWGGFMGGRNPGGAGGPGGMDGSGGMGGPGGMGDPMGGGIQDPMGSMDDTPSDANSESESTSIKGLKAAGSILITGGTFHIDSADDAIHSNSSITINGGTYEIASGDDGFHADETLTITAGTITVSESYEGLEALHIAVSGGDISLTASDDGLNAAGGTDSSGMGGFRGNDMFGGGGSSNGSIVISGGNLYVNASGDGIDANGSLTIFDGFVTVCGPTMGDTATLDYDTSAVITGGTFIGTGASQMAQTFSDSEQGVIAVTVGNQSAGTQITLTDEDGNTIISYAPELSYGVVILSSPDMVKGETYTITVGSASGSFAAN